MDWTFVAIIFNSAQVNIDCVFFYCFADGPVLLLFQQISSGLHIALHLMTSITKRSDCDVIIIAITDDITNETVWLWCHRYIWHVTHYCISKTHFSLKAPWCTWECLQGASKSISRTVNLPLTAPLVKENLLVQAGSLTWNYLKLLKFTLLPKNILN